MELNVCVIPQPIKKKQNRNKVKKRQQSNQPRKVQPEQNEFSFTFNKTDKVSATVAKIRQPGSAFKSVKTTSTTSVSNDDSLKQNQNANAVGKKKVIKYLPTVKGSYGPRNIDKVTESKEKPHKANDKLEKQVTPNKSHSDSKLQNKLPAKKNSMAHNSYEDTLESPKHTEKQGTEHKIIKRGKPVNQSKITSLFGNNPEVPTVGQRLVKPVTENVFCGKSLSSINIHPHAVKNLKDLLNITELTTVQEKTIPVLLEGRDVLVRSQTGSGKTLAYGLPIVQKLQEIHPKINRNQGVLALIVVPTRELAIQTYELFVKLLKPFTWIVPGYLMGGEKRKSEKARLRKGINILIGTPGRLCDHLINSSHLKLDSVKWLILDEADRLLELGYERDVKEIVQSLSKEKENSWYDPMELMKKAVEKNVEAVKGVLGNRKVFEESEEENENDSDQDMDEAEDDENDADDNEDSNDEEENVDDDNDDDSDEDENDNEDPDEEENDQESDADSEESDSDADGNVKKHRGLKMFQGTKKSTETSPKPKSVNKVQNSDEEKNTEDEKVDVQNPGKKTKDTMQTVLLSATLTPAVENLAGLALRNPIFIESSEDKTGKVSQSGEFSGAVKDAVNDEMMSIPSSIIQTYILVPPKLRLVTLSGMIFGECQKKPNAKILVFVSTQHLVDFHCALMTRVLGGSDKGDDSDSDDENIDVGVKLAADVKFFKLHGTMSQQERTKVFKEFRAVKAGVLFCTDVAARGLDVPSVGLVVQYTPPVEAADYAHRVGRTARGGRAGKAALILAPHEAEYVRELEDRRVRLKQEPLETSLESLLSPRGPCSTTQAAATALQQRFEEALLKDRALMQMACKAFSSWARFYSAFPREWKPIFNVKLAHTGHYAKSLALREAPGNKNMRQVAGAPEVKERPKNRLTRERDAEVDKREKRRASGGQHAVRGFKGAQKRAVSQKERQRQLVISEFDGGLPPNKKQRKN